MKKAIVVAFALVVVAGLSTIASQARAAEKGMKGNAVIMPASDIKWTDVPDFPGVKMAVVQGDASKGPHHAFIKLPAGFTAPLHHHTADHYATILSGTVIFTIDGQDHKLSTGSYFSFTGKKSHVTKCEATADCVLFNDVRAKWDVVPEERKATKM